MQHKHLLFFGVAAVAFFYLNSGTSTTAQKVPLVSSLYNLGYNLAGGSFSLSTPVASAS